MEFPFWKCKCGLVFSRHEDLQVHMKEEVNKALEKHGID